MMAELSHEHALAKAEADKDDPDVVTVGAVMHRFVRRIKVLSLDGLIMSADVQHTFTAEI